jgi:hypothetical protein
MTDNKYSLGKDKGVGCSRTYYWACYHRIIKILEDVADSNLDERDLLGSETGREFLAEKIMEALDK